VSQGWCEGALGVWEVVLHSVDTVSSKDELA